ncbi:FCS-Like Zinc finger 5-like [Humulus lupulus]|uniref:FCS-Like Zinc finger 5-like n=1 Tax=Humulus lupulus TaxID=3486 RepID=UPI002B411B77|nr:FCS-Like Zinc finger 5-like [Humulus lupulus]
MLGKRVRSTVKKTTTTSEVTFELITSNESQPVQPLPYNPLNIVALGDQLRQVRTRNFGGFTAPPQTPTNSTSHFLRVCYLCKRLIRLDSDTYMYRSIAFCNQECRQMMISHDERMEKMEKINKRGSSNKEANTAATSARPHVFTKSETTTFPALWPSVFTPKK